VIDLRGGARSVRARWWSARVALDRSWRSGQRSNSNLELHFVKKGKPIVNRDRLRAGLAQLSFTCRTVF
jgi:hypothetical protein